MNKCSCLIVDDDSGTRLCFKLLFESLFDRTPYIAKDIFEAKNIINNTHPELLLVDYLLGDSTALDLFKYVETIEDYHPKLVIISALGEEVIKNSNYPYLLKPFDIKELEKIIIDNVSVYDYNRN